MTLLYIFGQAVSEIFSRKPRLLQVMDISNNNLVEVVRDLRGALGTFGGEFNTFAIDFGVSRHLDRGLTEQIVRVECRM